jgi:hypothetical protein
MGMPHFTALLNVAQAADNQSVPEPQMRFRHFDDVV